MKELSELKDKELFNQEVDMEKQLSDQSRELRAIIKQKDEDIDEINRLLLEASQEKTSLEQQTEDQRKDLNQLSSTLREFTNRIES